MTRGHRVAGAVALTLCAPLVLGACSSDKKVDTASDSSSTSTTAPVNVNSGPTVEVVEFAFTPSAEAVKVGDTVTWENDGNSPHTVTPDPLPDGTVPWVSSQIEPTETFVQTFSAPGTYSYICSIHPDRMSGSVTVSAG